MSAYALVAKHVAATLAEAATQSISPDVVARNLVLGASEIGLVHIGPIVLAPFGQVDSGLGRKYEGTGLGLTIVKTMIELHSGRLAIESTLGKGSTFPLRFPPERPGLAEAA